MKKKGVILLMVILVLCVALAVVGFLLYGNMQMGKIPALSFEEALEYTTKDNDAAVITVGIIKDGEASYTVYGSNGALLPHQPHIYEIGSLTKTFTAALTARALEEGRLNLDDSISSVLSLPDGRHYPTVGELLTHTSGYKGYYFEAPMVSNFLSGKNDFCGITKEMVLERAASVSTADGEHPFLYSNFGYAVLGLVLEEVYREDYAVLIDRYLRELGLENTKLSDGLGDLGNAWDWQDGDAYLPAGGITSDITDMLAYAQMQLDGTTPFAQCHVPLATIDASNERYKLMGIDMDEIGMAWITDREDGFLWHNGGTGSYNSYIGFDPTSRTAVVVLSNLSPSSRIPATVLGVKLLQSLRA